MGIYGCKQWALCPSLSMYGDLLKLVPVFEKSGQVVHKRTHDATGSVRSPKRQKLPFFLSMQPHLAATACTFRRFPVLHSSVGWTVKIVFLLTVDFSTVAS